MADVRLICIRKPNPQSPHEHITHVGDGSQVWPREQVVRWIDERAHSFLRTPSRPAGGVLTLALFGSPARLRIFGLTPTDSGTTIYWRCRSVAE
jgi:hypothetical protein